MTLATPHKPRAAQAKPIDYIPSTARAVVTTGRLDGLLKMVGALAPKLPEAIGFSAMKTQWEGDYGFDPFQAHRWGAWGVDSAAPAAVFNTHNGWVLVAQLSDPDVFGRWREAYASKLAFDVQQQGGFTYTKVSKTQGRAISVATREDLILILFPAVSGSHERFVADVESWSHLPDKARFTSQPWVADAQTRLKSSMTAFVRPDLWVEDTQETGQAAVVWTRMKAQMGPVAFSADFDVMKRQIALTFLSQSDRTEPTFVASMGKARGKLPVVGALVDPGVLGVIRISVDPKNMYALVRSLLPATDRTELDRWIKEIREVLNLDVERDVLTNLTGHAVVVVYGFNSGVLDPNNAHLAADLVSLDATREAILLPIESDERLRTVLDAVTTLSEGRLKRQATGDSVQYAWIEDESLAWAIIVAKNYAIVIDSTAAFDHAVTYERSARPLPKQLKDQGLGELFVGDRSSVYVDSGALSNLLNETGNQEAAQWLAPFRSVRGWTTEGENGTSKSSLILEIDE